MPIIIDYDAEDDMRRLIELKKEVAAIDHRILAWEAQEAVAFSDGDNPPRINWPERPTEAEEWCHDTYMAAAGTMTMFQVINAAKEKFPAAKWPSYHRANKGIWKTAMWKAWVWLHEIRPTLHQPSGTT